MFEQINIIAASVITKGLGPESGHNNTSLMDLPTTEEYLHFLQLNKI